MLEETFNGMKKGEEKAFDQFVAEYSSQIFAYALTVLRNREIAEEVTQKTMIKVVEKVHQLKDPSKFKPWLFKMTYRQCLDELKLKENKHEVIMEDFLLESYGEDMKKDDKSEVWDALDELTERNRTLIVGKYIYELSESEIAEMMKIPTGTVKSRLYTARQELKSIFEKRHLSPTSLSAVVSPAMIPWVMEYFNTTTTVASATTGAELAKRYSKKRAQRIALKSVVAASVAGAAVGGYFMLNQPEDTTIPEVVSEVNEKSSESNQSKIPEEETQKAVEETANAACSINGVDYTRSFVNTAVYLSPQVNCNQVNRITINGIDTQDVVANGTYTIAIWNNDQQLAEQSVVIDNIDTAAPVILSQTYDSDTEVYTIYLQDDLSGLNDSVDFYENGVLSTNVSYSASAGTLSFVYNSEVSYDIAVKDNAGNLVRLSVKEK